MNVSKKIRLFIVTLCCVAFTRATAAEYMYPVATNADESTVYVIHQKAANHIELWLWDPSTKRLEQGILSRYSPAGLSIVPDRNAFSFIDNGIIRIKEHIKRSPRTLEFTHPIYDFTRLNWINSTVMYASAKYRSYYGLFQIDQWGQVAPIVWDGIHDYRYPQKVNDSLFFVCKTPYRYLPHYTIEHITYPEIPSGKKLNDIVSEGRESAYEINMPQNRLLAKDLNPEYKSTIADQKASPISFLKMLSEHEGYYLSHPVQIETKELFIAFSYHTIRKVGDEWVDTHLFSFKIPTELLMGAGDKHLYESILPLLPVHQGNVIHFVNATLADYGYNLNTFCYHTDTASIAPSSQAVEDGLHYFGVHSLGQQMICGGSVSEGEGGVKVWIGDDGFIYADFPTVVLNS